MHSAKVPLLFLNRAQRAKVPLLFLNRAQRAKVPLLITAIGVVIMLISAFSLAGCATYIPIKSVRMPTINGMDTVKNLGIRDFENRSGVGGSVGAQLTNYLTDKSKQMIMATGKFTIGK